MAVFAYTGTSNDFGLNATSIPAVASVANFDNNKNPIQPLTQFEQQKDIDALIGFGSEKTKNKTVKKKTQGKKIIKKKEKKEKPKKKKPAPRKQKRKSSENIFD